MSREYLGKIERGKANPTLPVTAQISHGLGMTLEQFTVEVDFYADGQWHDYQHLTVEPGKALVHDFPQGYAAHWLRVKARADCAATAQLEYR